MDDILEYLNIITLYNKPPKLNENDVIDTVNK
jgi:hypothetical protein